MSAKSRIAIKIFFVLLAAAITVAAVWQYARVRALNNSLAQKQGEAAPEAPELIKTVQLPVPMGSENVAAAFIIYYFNGNIKKIDSLPDGRVELVLDTNNSEIPKIFLSSQTPISKPPAPGKKPDNFFKLADIKPGMNIDVSMQYDPVLKIWMALGVFLRSGV